MNVTNGERELSHSYRRRGHSLLMFNGFLDKQRKKAMKTILDMAFVDIGRVLPEHINEIRRAPETLEIRLNQSARELAQQVKQKQSNLVIILDDTNNVRGVVEPSYVQQLLTYYRQDVPEDFSESILKLAQVQTHNLVFPAPARLRPTLYWCEKGKHFTSDDPCQVHP